MNVTVKLKKVHSDAVLPKYAKELDSGFDLVAIEDTIIHPGASAMIRTGIAVALPLGLELQVRPRSGVSINTKLRISNAPGTIDAGYRGEICVLMDNISQYPIPNIVVPVHVDGVNAQGEKVESGVYLIRKGDRIAQGVLANVLQADFEEVDELDKTERGTGGFGSSGVK
ncbi:dUTP diphosphatase [Paenibacillus chitinolyticus]